MATLEMSANTQTNSNTGDPVYEAQETLTSAGIINIVPSDVIKLEVRNVTDSTNVLVVNCNVNLHRLI